MTKAQLAFGLLLSASSVLATSPALADCGPGAPVALIGDYLPLPARAPDQQRAALALPYAAMILFVSRPPQSPPGFERGPGPGDLLAGGYRLLAAMTEFNPATFVSCSGRAVVIAFDGLRDYSVRDYATAAVRRLGGGHSELGTAFTAAVLAAYPGYAVSIIGYSAGGDVASSVAGSFGLPSITFNAAPSEASIMGNDGSRQLNVIARNDWISDRTVTLRGDQFHVDVEGGTHQIEALIDVLAAVATR
ncbi:MAG: hypothetical protein ACWA6X_07100 [Bauldia sp.]